MLSLIKLWIYAHLRQLVTLALWGGVMYGAHRWPAHTSDVELVASGVALMVGIQLPPFKLSAEALTKIIGGVLLIGALALSPLALLKCDAPAGSFKGTQTAAAALAVDFSECVEDDFLALAKAGELSKEAAFAAAEKCGVSNVKDGIALLVAVFNDVKHYLLAKHSPLDAGVDASDEDAGSP